MKKSIDAFAMQIIFIKENDIFVSEKNPGIKYSFMGTFTFAKAY